MGLNGVFNAVGSEWNWQIGLNYGKAYDTSQDTGFTDIASLATGLDSPGYLQCNGPGQSAPGSTSTWDTKLTVNIIKSSSRDVCL